MTTTIEFITALFCQVDDQLAGLPKHPEAHLWPSEVVTLGLLHALKGGGNRPFYRWLTRDYRALFPRLPGSVSEVDFKVSQQHPKFVAVDKQADDDVMHLNRLGEADRLTGQPLDPRA